MSPVITTVSSGKCKAHRFESALTLFFPRLGPVDLTVGVLSPDTNSEVPTVTDNLFSQGTISSDTVSVSFEPATSSSDQSGELTFGDTDSTKFTGSITTM